jgi:tetratricopeptide (TPR) repeat protein
MKTLQPFIIIGLIVILGFAAYGNSLSGAFIWDDTYLVRDNPLIRSWSHLGRIFAPDTRTWPEGSVPSYRPLRIPTYMLDYAVGKLNPIGYHLTNIILHIMVALCLYRLTTLLFNDRVLSLITSALFIVHPIHTEVVAYISGRADALAALFMLVCFILYIQSLHTKTAGSYAAMLVTYVMALLSKESSLIFPVVVLLYHLALSIRVRKSQFIPLVLIALTYIGLRITVLGTLLPHASSPTTVLERLPGFFVAVATYIRLLISPGHLHMEYGNPLFHVTDPRAIAGLVLMGLLLIITLKRRKRSPLPFFATWWFFLTLLPVSNIYPLIIAYMAEHWLYIPSMGFFIVVARGFSLMYRSGTKALRFLTFACLVGLVGMSIAATMEQNEYWSNPLTFYTRTLRYAPDSGRLYYNLGNTYRELCHYPEAIDAYEKALAINPHDEDAYNVLGATYHSIGKPQDAVRWYQKALDINPAHSKTWYNLGLAYEEMGKDEDAMELYQKALNINPDFADAYHALGRQYAEQEHYQDAIGAYTKALHIDPYSAEVCYDLGIVYSAQGRDQEAVALYERAIRINPRYGEAYNNLGTSYYKLGRAQQALAAYQEAIRIDAQHAQAYNNLGIIYYDLGRAQEAITAFKKALAIRPRYAKAHNNLALAYYHEGDYEQSITHCDKAGTFGFINSPLREALEPHRDKD